LGFGLKTILRKDALILVDNIPYKLAISEDVIGMFDRVPGPKVMGNLLESTKSSVACKLVINNLRRFCLLALLAFLASLLQIQQLLLFGLFVTNELRTIF
jgi:hypothetical protein